MIPLSLPEPDSAARAHSDRLLQHIRQEIAAAGGAVSFARYMELALYTPGLGYYSAGATKFGAAGDFVTAPELGDLFAGCLANAFARVLGELDAQACVFELGGGSGAFAGAVLRRLAELERLPAAYWILEPSADLRERQRERVAASLPAELARRVRWLDGLPEQPWQGVLFANEVLDALPTTRFCLREGEVFEEFVAVDEQGALQRVDRPADALVAGSVRALERALGEPFADGYRSETLVQLPWWLEAVAGCLQRGLVLFADYGYPRREFYRPERRDGTLICHYRHRAHAEPLFLPGLNDISAFVDFTAVAEAGLAAGFEHAGFCSQSGFLLGNGLEALLAAPGADARALRERNEEARKLVLPGEMGERFKFIGLQRAIESEALFALGEQSRRL